VVPEREDNDLINRFLEGDEQAFNLLVRKHQDFVYNVTRKICGNHEDAIEASQRVFVKLYDKLQSFNRSASFRTWLYRIAVNDSLNLLRSKRLRRWLRFGDLAAEPEDPEPDPLDAYIEREQRERLMRAADRLPDRQRTVFVLRMTEGLSYGEIAEILNVSVGSLKASFFHAVQKIRKDLQRDYE
jgi:RNA polymerase sigma-70 factor, ECF subfamily